MGLQDIITRNPTVAVAVIAALAAIFGAVISAIVTWATGARRYAIDEDATHTGKFTATIGAFEKLIQEQRLLLVETRVELQAARLCVNQLSDRVLVLQGEIVSQKIRIEVLEAENVKLSADNGKLQAEVVVLRESIVLLNVRKRNTKAIPANNEIK